MWYHDNWKLRLNGKRNVVMLAWNMFLLAISLFLTGAGTYGAVIAIKNDPNRTAPWSCEDNSNTVEKAS